MSLLAILFSMVIERYVDAVASIRNYTWTVRFSDWVKEKFSHSEFWNDTLGLVVILLVPFFICAIIYDQLFDAMEPLAFLFALAVLVYCINPKRMYSLSRQYLDAGENDDQHSMQTYASEMMPDESFDDTREMNSKVSIRMLTSTNNEVLAVFFWFVLLGPMGALLFRMSAALFENTRGGYSNESEMENEAVDYTEFNSSARMLYGILLWLPTQISILCFAIAGSFIDTLQTWKQRLTSNYLDPDQSDETLYLCGFSSLQLDLEQKTFDLGAVNEVYALAFRTIIVWVTILALLILAGLIA